MKLVQTAKTLQTNADFTSQDFTIGDVSVVIEILRNKLYRHKIRTLVQEYISNARDAMREINSKDRIEVTVPTTFSPTFKVRDFGPGIDEKRMNNVFIKYAASTKRKDNKQTGGFGIGAKSAWSYTESFTIVTYIDGVQRTYIAHIGANNNGRLDFMGEDHTDAPNGTEIQIPVSPSDVSEFKKSAFRAVYFWNEKEQPIFKNVVAGEKQERVYGETIDNLELNNNVPDYVVSKWDKGIIIAIDGIPYIADEKLISKIPTLTHLDDLVEGKLIINISNGELEVAASREEIADSQFTVDALSRIAKTAHTSITNVITKEFSKAKTPFDHLSIYMKLKDNYNLEAYRTKDIFRVTDKNSIESDVFKDVKIEHCTVEARKMNLVKRNISKTRRSYYSNGGVIKAEWFNSLFYIDGTETTMITNWRIKAYLTNNPNIVVFTKQDNDSGQFAQLKKGLGLKDIKTISYVKPDRKTRDIIKIERTKKEFVLHDLERYRNQARTTSLETNVKKWYWIDHALDYDKVEHQALAEYLVKQGWSICALGKDAQRRVKGDSNFKPLSEFFAKFKVTKTMIASLKNEKASQHEAINALKKLKGLTDKTVKSMVDEYAGLNSEYIPEMLKKVIGEPDEVKDFVKLDKELAKHLADTYPLLQDMSYSWSDKLNDEIVIYMNAK